MQIEIIILNKSPNLKDKYHMISLIFGGILDFI